MRGPLERGRDRAGRRAMAGNSEGVGGAGMHNSKYASLEQIRRGRGGAARGDADERQDRFGLALCFGMQHAMLGLALVRFEASFERIHNDIKIA
ncbi:hypothetical protein EVAR_47191_1 [Eumeta japonica]|uniref:Uncharacterized protein n=1 Tax=Eumeta variegata TaxID=151549 RepID=A0A4C1WTH5_EUMVA|nr:hypothetical protein EVAR_47191_1 [Eumeta japonica]